MRFRDANHDIYIYSKAGNNCWVIVSISLIILMKLIAVFQISISDRLEISLKVSSLKFLGCIIRRKIVFILKYLVSKIFGIIVTVNNNMLIFMTT